MSGGTGASLPKAYAEGLAEVYIHFRALLTDTTSDLECSVAARIAADVRRDAGRRRLYYLAGGEAPTWKGKAMRKKQKVAEMADEVLARQARTRAARTGESLEDALKAVMGTEAGRQLKELRDGPHRDERAEDWQKDLARERAEERADALGWFSSNEVPGSPADAPRRGLR